MDRASSIPHLETQILLYLIMAVRIHAKVTWTASDLKYTVEM